MQEVLRERLEHFKKNFDIFGIKGMSDKDRQIAEYVAAQLSIFKTGAIKSWSFVNLDTAITGALDNLKLLGDDVVVAAKGVTTKKFLPIEATSFSYSCNIAYDDSRPFSKGLGVVNYFKVPFYLESITADIFLAHEFIHALKDTNFNEYILHNSLADVIPLFFELVQISEKPEKQKAFLNVRMMLLNNSKKDYKMATDNMARNKNDKDLYEVLQGVSGQYLSSFYYSLILFNIYRSDPALVLQAVRKVLNHEMTTLEMLNSLGIYQENNDKIVDREFKFIRKSLR